MSRTQALLRQAIPAIFLIAAATASALLFRSRPPEEPPSVEAFDAEIDAVFREAEAAGLVIRVEAERPPTADRSARVAAAR